MHVPPSKPSSVLNFRCKEHNNEKGEVSKVFNGNIEGVRYALYAVVWEKFNETNSAVDKTGAAVTRERCSGGPAIILYAK